MRINKFCRLSLQPLEGREVPTAAMVGVTNLPAGRLNVLPGDTNKVVANLWVATPSSQIFAQPTEMLFIPAFGGGSLSQNTSGFKLMADLNGKKSDGCEALLATAVADYQTDVVDFNISVASWANRSHPLRIQVVANFTWLLPSDRMGVQLAKANFNDINGESIPDSAVIYRGYKPILHKLNTATLYMVQEQMTASANVHVGDRVSLAKFFVGNYNTSSFQMMFSASKGSLARATNYTLVHTSWSGVQDASISGTVINGKLMFKFNKGFTTGNWQLMATIADGSVGSHLQLALPMDGTSISAYDVDGKRLRGFRWNEMGGGQIQVSGQPSYGTDYTVIA